jgi:DNA polymerase (family X)
MPGGKSQLLSAFRETALLLELKGENPFRCRAYENAARVLEGIEGEPETWLAENRLEGIKGIGKGTLEHIQEWVRDGRIELHEQLRAEIPHGLLDMMDIPGLGPKKVKAVWEELGIDTVGKLAEAAKTDALASLPGFGRKTAEKILEGIGQREKFAGRFRVNIATARAEALREYLKSVKAIDRLELGGSLRRCRETIKDLDWVAVSDDPGAVMEAFISAPGVARVTNHGETKSSVVFEDGIASDLRVVSKDQFAAALLYFTGSKEHNTRLRGRAKDMGFKLNEYGLFKEGSDRALACADEAAIYKRLGLAYIEPELREDTGEIEAAETGELPELIRAEDMKGVLHCHSTYSDGKSTLAEMAEAARKLGYGYFGICDHSRAAAYAGGLSEDDVRRQHDEIDELNASLKDGFRILKGIESDILGDGKLDYPDRFLARFDFIVVSIHSRFSMSREQMTDRICTALAHPAATILAHPTGRLLLEREGYEVDFERIFATAAEHRVAIEINANPHRLDLDWRLVRQALRAGCLLAINPDAHHTSGIEHIRYGVGIARKGWAGRADVINTKTLAQFRKWLKDRGQPSSGS